MWIAQDAPSEAKCSRKVPRGSTWQRHILIFSSSKRQNKPFQEFTAQIVNKKCLHQCWIQSLVYTWENRIESHSKSTFQSGGVFLAYSSCTGGFTVTFSYVLTMYISHSLHCSFTSPLPHFFGQFQRVSSFYFHTPVQSTSSIFALLHSLCLIPTMVVYFRTYRKIARCFFFKPYFMIWIWSILSKSSYFKGLSGAIFGRFWKV
jgi:hypothetical protein